MSEQETRPNAPVSDSTSQGIGARLAQEREAKGWSQDYVSERLKFSLRQLRALEDEEWEKLPQGVPLRGFVRNYARLLGIDITAQLHALPGNTDPVSLNQASTLTTPLANARKSTREWPASSRTRRRPATWLVGVLMLLVAIALIVLALYRQGKLPGFAPAEEESLTSPANPVLAPPTLSMPSAPDPAPAPPLSEPAAPAAPLPPAQEPVSPLPEPQGPAAAEAPATANGAADAASQQAATEAAAAPAKAGLSLVLTQDSWFEVRRANGSVVISRVLKVGEDYQLEAAEAPYSVVIGNIQGVMLTWRGEPVDLSGYRGNVARLTLK